MLVTESASQVPPRRQVLDDVGVPRGDRVEQVDHAPPHGDGDSEHNGQGGYERRNAPQSGAERFVSCGPIGGSDAGCHGSPIPASTHVHVRDFRAQRGILGHERWRDPVFGVGWRDQYAS